MIQLLFIGAGARHKAEADCLSLYFQGAGNFWTSILVLASPYLLAGPWPADSTDATIWRGQSGKKDEDGSDTQGPVLLPCQSDAINSPRNNLLTAWKSSQRVLLISSRR